jgi:hypothetical protein
MVKVEARTGIPKRSLFPISRPVVARPQRLDAAGEPLGRGRKSMTPPFQIFLKLASETWGGEPRSAMKPLAEILDLYAY